METIDERAWKAVAEQCMRNGHRQVNSVDGRDGIRTYYNGKRPVARMRVINSETDLPGYECKRTFEATKKLLKECRKIYIPTQEEVDHWDDVDSDLDIADLIAQKEAEL